MEDVMQLFEEIDSLLTELDEVSSDFSFLEDVENVEDFLAIVLLARGVVRGDLEISSISPERVEAAKTRLQVMLDALSEDEDE